MPAWVGLTGDHRGVITKYGNPTWARAADPGSQMPPLTRGAVSSVATRWGQLAKNKAFAVYPPPRAREKRTPRASHRPTASHRVPPRPTAGLPAALCAPHTAHAGTREQVRRRPSHRAPRAAHSLLIQAATCQVSARSWPAGKWWPSQPAGGRLAATSSVDGAGAARTARRERCACRTPRPLACCIAPAAPQCAPAAPCQCHRVPCADADRVECTAAGRARLGPSRPDGAARRLQADGSWPMPEVSWPFGLGHSSARVTAG